MSQITNENTITEEEIESIHQDTMKKYGSDYTVMCLALEKYPNNTEENIIITKITLIDCFNSTQLIRYNKKITRSDIAKIIINIKDFDKRISQGDPSLVKEFAEKIRDKSKEKEKKGVNLFSFATKYCAYHNWYAHKKDDYSIYDSRVHKMLPLCNPSTITKATIEAWRKDCNYAEFNNYIGKLLDKNNIHIEDRRYKFDHFLWSLGKTKK